MSRPHSRSAPGLYVCISEQKRRSVSPFVAGPYEQAHGGGQSRLGSGTMRVCAVILAASLVLVPAGARAADLVVWWEEGFNPEEDVAVKEIIAAFEHKTGKKVQLDFFPPGKSIGSPPAVVEAGHPPDFLYGNDISPVFPQWAHEGRLTDLTDALGPLAAQFDRDTLEDATLFDATVGRRSLHALPMGRLTNHVHAWKSLLERAGLTLEDVPRQWEPFWAFWCDKVQSAVRTALGREDIWGVGLPMGTKGDDTDTEFREFMQAYGADYVTRDGRLVIDEPEVRAKLVKAIDGYTAIHRKGCTPPEAAEWDNRGNNKAFLEQRVVMTPNPSLSIPGELRAARPEDYYKNAVTLGWPGGIDGQPLAIATLSSQAVVFRGGGHEVTATEFVRFLVGEGWLAHWLDFTGDDFLPPMPALLVAPFWLDPGDPHRIASAIQFATRPRAYSYAAVSGEWRHQLVLAEGIWREAVHRIVADGLSPEQATDEAIARVKQLLSE
jgi:multiple sugar transport system substrate-binding protein